MVEIRYANLTKNSSVQGVQGMGNTNGPPLGDNWDQLESLPEADMPAGAGQYAILVHGKISGIVRSGTGDVRGVAQVCLGTTAGTRHPDFVFSLPVHQGAAGDEGWPFQFLLIVSAAVPDALFGSSFDPSGSQLCLWARSYWNGDPQTYSATFQVTDVTWLWFDLGAIPAGHFAIDRDTTQVAIPSSPTPHQRLAPASYGDAGERWLCFANVWYEPRQYHTDSPYFRFGCTDDATLAGLQVRLGSGGKWGQNKFPANSNLPHIPQQQNGGFWVWDPANSLTRGVMSVTSTIPCYVKRYTHLAIRIDTLTDVLVYQNHSTSGVTGGLQASNPDWYSHHQTLERPFAGILTEPIVLAHGVMQCTVPTSYAARLFENSYSGIWEGEVAGVKVTPSYGEAAASVFLTRRVFHTTSPAMQWHLTFAGEDDSPVGGSLVHDPCLVQFHPVRDPENITDTPDPPPPPIVLVPGRQSASVATLLAPPTPPSGQEVRRGSPLVNSIESVVGYRRRWPLGGRPTRIITLTWPSMPGPATRAVFEFLVANPAWKLTPNDGGTAIAVMNAGRPEMTQGDTPSIYTVQVDVAVLRFTGP